MEDFLRKEIVRKINIYRRVVKTLNEIHELSVAVVSISNMIKFPVTDMTRMTVESSTREKWLGH